MRMYTDPKGEAYEQVIDLAIRNSECFVLGEKMLDGVGRSQYTSELEALEPFLVKSIVIQGDIMDDVTQIRNTYRSHAFYSAGTYYFYRCCEESGNLLKQMANRLSDWIYPNLPEDLCFLKEDGGDYLYSVVHERMYGLEVTEEEAIDLMDQITGLFLELKAHRDLDRLLDDAIKHKTDWLYISGHGLTELPERIRELTELRDLEIFEQDLYRLPEGLFELIKLERLSILTADLESIPASIARLKKLRVLNIQCASSDRPAPGYRAKPKDKISLNRIPPEIGELDQLEQLTIQYTSIHELPPELEKLKHLQILDLGMCMIKRKPDFLNNMKQLKYINVSQDSLWETIETEQ
ncbi:leucine-rich repeat domain-containing protein [Paenibacillus sp. MMS18-CY102]|uniref:leucine-rich repeat domain-containing protein n=1 Tax=Paenibacillus sp. MMS18-CY102 TaxID=2682849 RepID=UPI001366481D|nr:leucine-rich repeat domain-containing protein [Paenibacillus sp. MMS18-CY102]MWC29910.1 leucine-rich repeat domain-containing protein [Paenibacillus sp. MMS18-CY102]